VAGASDLAHVTLGSVDRLSARQLRQRTIAELESSQSVSQARPGWQGAAHKCKNFSSTCAPALLSSLMQIAMGLLHHTFTHPLRDVLMECRHSTTWPKFSRLST
jgi:hypothetical protein